MTCCTGKRSIIPSTLPCLDLVSPCTENAPRKNPVMQAFPTILYAFPMCCVVWTWDSLFYGASDFVYNAKAVAVASLCGVIGRSQRVFLVASVLVRGFACSIVCWYRMCFLVARVSVARGQALCGDVRR